jgi:hypothetical protein
MNNLEDLIEGISLYCDTNDKKVALDNLTRKFSLVLLGAGLYGLYKAVKGKLKNDTAPVRQAIDNKLQYNPAYVKYKVHKAKVENKKLIKQNNSNEKMYKRWGLNNLKNDQYQSNIQNNTNYINSMQRKTYTPKNNIGGEPQVPQSQVPQQSASSYSPQTNISQDNNEYEYNE